jgi:hypothetical protein
MATPSVLESVKSHLEFLGYTFSKDGDLWIGGHASRPLIGLSEYEHGILFTAVYFATTAAAEDEIGFVGFANSANTGSRIARYGVYKNDHLTVEAWFPNFYNRPAFGTFFESWLEEMKDFFDGEQDQTKKYLK